MEQPKDKDSELVTVEPQDQLPVREVVTVEPQDQLPDSEEHQESEKLEEAFDPFEGCSNPDSSDSSDIDDFMDSFESDDEEVESTKPVETNEAAKDIKAVVVEVEKPKDKNDKENDSQEEFIFKLMVPDTPPAPPEAVETVERKLSVSQNMLRIKLAKRKQFLFNELKKNTEMTSLKQQLTKMGKAERMKTLEGRGVTVKIVKTGDSEPSTSSSSRNQAAEAAKTPPNYVTVCRTVAPNRNQGMSLTIKKSTSVIARNSEPSTSTFKMPPNKTSLPGSFGGGAVQSPSSSSERSGSPQEIHKIVPRFVSSQFLRKRAQSTATRSGSYITEKQNNGEFKIVKIMDSTSAFDEIEDIEEPLKTKKLRVTRLRAPDGEHCDSPEPEKYLVPQDWLMSDTEKVTVSESGSSSAFNEVENKLTESLNDEDDDDDSRDSLPSALLKSRRKSSLVPKEDSDVEFQEQHQPIPRPQGNVDLIDNLAKYRVLISKVLKKLDMPEIDFSEDSDNYINIYKIYKN